MCFGGYQLTRPTRPQKSKWFYLFPSSSSKNKQDTLSTQSIASHTMHTRGTTYFPRNAARACSAAFQPSKVTTHLNHFYAASPVELNLHCIGCCVHSVSTLGRPMIQIDVRCGRYRPSASFRRKSKHLVAAGPQIPLASILKGTNSTSLNSLLRAQSPDPTTAAYASRHPSSLIIQ